MHILVLNPFDAHAGSQRVGRDIVELLTAAGYDVRVRLGFGGSGFLSDIAGLTPDLRCANVRLRKLLYPLWSLLVTLPVALAALQGRVVWANTVYAVLPAALAALIRPRRVVIHLHEATFPGVFMPLLRLMVRRGVRVVCVSADQAARIGLPATILSNAVTLPVQDAPSTRDRLLFVGTTQSIKGFALFVEVSERLGGLPLRKVAYLSDDTRHDRSLVAAARQAGIDIVFGESSPDALYRDGFLLLQATDPARWTETFSLVAVEAMARLVPVAGAGATVLVEVLGDALAFDMPSRNPQAIADAISALHADPIRYDALRAACARRRANFTEDVFFGRLTRLLHQMDLPRP